MRDNFKCSRLAGERYRYRFSSLYIRLLACALAVSLASCAVSPPAFAPEYGAAPPTIEPDASYVENIETIEIDVPLDDFLAWRDQVPLSEILTPIDGMPAVDSTVILTGDDRWGDVGDRRRIELSDGHYAVETVLDSTRNRFYYQVWGYTSRAGSFFNYAVGEFQYEEVGDRTQVTWTYQFNPNSWLTRIPLSQFVRNRFTPFMKNGLRNMKTAAEAAT